ncbi:MAG: hypothetical protein AAGI68_00055 [Planctomycetota bacterium]
MPRSSISRRPDPVLLLASSAITVSSLLFFAPGCTTKGQVNPGTTRPADATPGAAGLWHPVASQLRVFPTTRFVIERGRPVLEARVEVLDPMGHPLKTSGQFRFELFAAPSGADRATQKLYTWNQSLSTADDQREHFDPVTFAYRFQLQLRDQALESRPTILRVTLTTPAGPRLTTSHAVRTDW